MIFDIQTPRVCKITALWASFFTRFGPPFYIVLGLKHPFFLKKVPHKHGFEVLPKLVAERHLSRVQVSHRVQIPYSFQSSGKAGASQASPARNCCALCKHFPLAPKHHQVSAVNAEQLYSLRPGFSSKIMSLSTFLPSSILTQSQRPCELTFSLRTVP